MCAPKSNHLDCHSLDHEYYSDNSTDSNSHSIYRLQFVSCIESEDKLSGDSQGIDSKTSPLIPPGESISSILVLLQFVPGAYFGEKSCSRHVIRPPHPVDVTVSSSQVLAHGLELLPLRTRQASYIYHRAMMMLRSIHIPPFTPTIAAPNSSHRYGYYNPANKTYENPNDY